MIHYSLYFSCIVHFYSATVYGVTLYFPSDVVTPAQSTLYSQVIPLPGSEYSSCVTLPFKIVRSLGLAVVSAKSLILVPVVILVFIAASPVPFAYSSSANVCAAITHARVSAIICFFFALSIYPTNAGTSNAASIASITNTTINSTRVKPFFLFSFNFLFSLVLLLSCCLVDSYIYKYSPCSLIFLLLPLATNRTGCAYTDIRRLL